MTVTPFKERVEIALPARMMFAVATMDVFAFDPGEEDTGRGQLERMKALLLEACHAPMEGLAPKIRSVVNSQIDRLHVQAMGEYDGQRADKVAAAVFYFLKALTDSGYLELWEGSPVAQAAAIYTPAIEHVFGEGRLDASAQKAARRILDKLQARGYYR
jgi:hypothetical protein